MFQTGVEQWRTNDVALFYTTSNMEFSAVGHGTWFAKSTISVTVGDILRKLPDAVVLETGLDDASDPKPCANRYSQPKSRSYTPKIWHKRCQIRMRHALHQCAAENLFGRKTAVDPRHVVAVRVSSSKRLYTTPSVKQSVSNLTGLDRSPFLGNIVNNVCCQDGSICPVRSTPLYNSRR